ncbi:MAG: hypothetical protein AB1540_02310 [Bdellovibrionota bacterium]
MTKLLYKIPAKPFLVLMVLLALLPFLDLRVLRMAGDEKVYLTTAIEMARDGRWFVQTLADEPNYFKGPLHYLFTRAGLSVFGDRLIAGLWMNAALALAAAFAMYSLGRKRWGEKNGLLLGVATALNVGVFSHALASQMEVELCAFFAFAAAALGLNPARAGFRGDVVFWLIAGVAGWAKSPVYSVLIGLSGILYWALTGQLVSRLRSSGSWLAFLTGALVGIGGYAPAFFLDRENFVNTFILREQFQKANNRRAWHYVLLPLIHFALPWTFVVLAGLAKMARMAFLSPQKRLSLLKKADLQMMKLGLAIALPSLVMWSTWTYKGQNYNLPTMAGLLLFGWACFNGEIPKLATRLAGAIGLVFFAALLAVVLHFWPLPDWWGRGWLLLSFAGILAFSATFLLSEDFRVLTAGAVAFFIAFGALITPPGEREMLDIRRFVKEHKNLTYHYYNLDPSIWSEWSVLQLTLHQPIYGLHKAHQLAKAVQPGNVILVQNISNLNRVMDYWRKLYGPESGNVSSGGSTSGIGVGGSANADAGTSVGGGTVARTPVVTPWTRWLTKGKTPEGKSKWKAAWEGRDLRQLEREFFIVWFP